MKSNEAGTTLKHPESFHGNVKNLSKRMKMKIKENVIAQFVARIKGLRFEGQTGVTGTNPTQCHHNGMVLSL
jgi:hypothetical protein